MLRNQNIFKKKLNNSSTLEGVNKTITYFTSEYKF